MSELFEISINSAEEMDYFFATELTLEEEITQNIINIVTRIKGNVPLNREKGIENTLIDEPQEIVKARLSAQIIDEIEREEPRFVVDEVIYKGSDFNTVLNILIRGYIKER